MPELTNLFTTLTNYITGFASALAVFILAIGGIMYAISTGNVHRMETAKSTMINAMIGLIITLAAHFIVPALIKSIPAA